MAAKARYGLPAWVGWSELDALALGEAEYIGIRQAAERLRREYARLTGASKPEPGAYRIRGRGDDRREGGAVLDDPPIYQSAISDRPA